MNQKQVLITGAGGYLGTEMVNFFLEAGYRVKALDRFFFGDTLQKYSDNPNLEIIKHDTRYCESGIFRGVDSVIDLAGLSNDPSAELDPRLTEEINQNGSIRVAKLAKENGIRGYLFASSCSVYGHGVNVKLTEESPLSPVSLYAKAKIAVEKELLEIADDQFVVTILRNATCYGLSSRMRFDLAVNLMTLHAHQKGKIIILGGGKQWRPFVHVHDVARAYKMVLDAEPQRVQKQIFNVGSDEQNYQIARLAHIVKNYFPRVDIEYAPDDPDRRDYNVSFDKISKVLGFKPVNNVQDGIVKIKEALEDGSLTDNITTNTVKYYKYLIDADALLEKVKHNGRLF